MLRRLPGFCLGALLLTAAIAGAKPPDLPDDPPIIVAPHLVPAELYAQQYAPADPQVPIPYSSTRPEDGGVYTFSHRFRNTPQETFLRHFHLHPMLRQAMESTVLYTIHPISACQATDAPTPIPCTCPQKCKQPGQTVQYRTVMDNLQALEKANDLLALAKKLASAGHCTEALECLDQVRALVPGSSCAKAADEVANEVAQYAAFDTFKLAFEEAVRDYWATKKVAPFLGSCGLNQVTGFLEQVTQTQECDGSACPQCEKMHAAHAKKQACTSSCCKAGVEAQVTGLMKACYLALEQQRFGKATDLAREAHALDPKRVEGDPVVFKFGLLGEHNRTKGGQEECCEPTSTCPGCPAKKQSNNYPQTKGTLTISLGVNSDAGLTGSIALNERNFDVTGCCAKCAKCSKCATACCPLGKLSCCGVKLSEGCQAACSVLKELYCAPLVPNDAGNNCLTFGLSHTGQVNAFCRTRHEGVVYNVLLKDGIFLMWMTPEAKTK